MRLELEQHLKQAVHDGKSLEAVVGPNTLAFAESWARETPHQSSRGFTIILRWLIFDWLLFALLFLSVIALFEHLVLLSPSFPFSLVHVVAFALLGLFALLQALAGFFSPHIRSRFHYRHKMKCNVQVVLLVVCQHLCPNLTGYGSMVCRTGYGSLWKSGPSAIKASSHG